MAATRPIIDAICAQLQTDIPEALVDVYPDNPNGYNFIHPSGAVLVGYRSSQFGADAGLGRISQQRVMTITLTVIGANLHGDYGALAILDEARLSVVGFKPPNCTPCHLISEQFVDEEAGAWVYELTLQTETQQVERLQKADMQKFVAARLRREGEPLEPDLKPAAQAAKK